MTPDPRWLAAFKLLHGLQEISGPKSNPVILNWVTDLNAPSWFDDDDKAWCALAMNRVLKACDLPVSGTGYELFRAKSFEGYGDPLVIPAYGALMTFSRPEGAHVGIYLGERRDAYCIYGANQSNTVGIAWIAKARLTSTRWPANVPAPVAGRIWLNQNLEPVSTNEA